jgi:peptidoglycan hydrolase-like protein with peptidoglycan-binding domain
VLTAISVTVGDVVEEGDHILEVSGRPVFVMEGDVPAYRSLKPGVSGADITQLQEALRRLGFAPDSDGVYGEATEAAVAAFYTQAGYSAVPVSESESADRAAVEQALSDAQAAVVEAELAVEAARAPQPESVVAQAESMRNQAQRDLDDAIAAQLIEVDLAAQALEVAVSQRNQIAADPLSAPSAVSQADLAVSQAEAEVAKVERATANAVAAASEALWVATLALNEATRAPSGSAAEVRLEAAIEARDRAQVALDDWLAKSGATVAQGEIVFAPTLPADVQSAETSIGNIAATEEPRSSGAALVTLASGGLVVTTNLESTDVDLVRPGMAVDLLDEQTGQTYPAAISHIADAATTGVDGRSVWSATIAVDERLPSELAGRNIRVTIVSASTETEALVVPVAAITSAADGTTSVSIVQDVAPGVAPVDVQVTTGLSADGFVAIRPVTAGAVTIGDLVVVGR